MDILPYNELLEQRQYSLKEIKDATLIIHPKILDKYGLKKEKIGYIFEEGSNFTQLKTPIVDKFGNEFWDSEGYYMALRTNNLEIKKMIAFCSSGYGLSNKSRERYILEQNLIKRIDFMYESITKKFDNNPQLLEKLLATGDRQIIEYTFWNDIFFGISNKNNTGANVLGKLLTKYREKVKSNLKL